MWSELLLDNAAGYARLAIANIDRGYPYDMRVVWTGPDDVPPAPRERHPVFAGSYDWHSCVEMHWLLVRLLRVVPDAIPADEVRTVLSRQFTVDGLAAEARFMSDPDVRNSQRPYGWGWALALAHELSELDSPEWTDAYRPLADAVVANFLDWLPKATYPVRYGVHPNSAFGLGRALPYARRYAKPLADAIVDAAMRWYRDDADYPAGWEPSGSDFLSPALVTRFLPGLAAGHPASLFWPVAVSDPTDGQIAHLHGLNASRAWCWRRLGEVLTDGPDPVDPRIGLAAAAAERHAGAALPHVGGDTSGPPGEAEEHYMVTHWLAAYAVLLLS